MHYV